VKNIAILVDVSNLYYCIRKVHNGKKLSYKKFRDHVGGYGNIVLARAYGAAIGDEANAFIEAIRGFGFETYFKEPKVYSNEKGIRRKADWDVGIAIDMVKIAADQSIGLIVLATADSDMTAAVEYCQDCGKQVIVFGVNIGHDLREAADQFVEIPVSFLVGKGRRAKTREK
jgi:uncharacterized protein (TIGR00288 family)